MVAMTFAPQSLDEARSVRESRGSWRFEIESILNFSMVCRGIAAADWCRVLAWAVQPRKTTNSRYLVEYQE